MEPVVPFAAAVAAAGVPVGRWLQHRDVPVAPAVGTLVALPGEAAGRLAAAGIRLTGVAAVLGGAAIAAAGDVARQTAGQVERLVSSDSHPTRPARSTRSTRSTGSSRTSRS